MGSDYITTTPFYTLDAVDDELLAEILQCDLIQDWKSVLSQEKVKERLESQGVSCNSREDISWDNATILFTLSISLDSNKIPIKLGDLKNRERFGRFPSEDGSALNYFTKWTKSAKRESNLMERSTYEELMTLISKLNSSIDGSGFSEGHGGLKIHGWLSRDETSLLRKAIKSGQWGVASDEPLDGGVRDIIKHLVSILRSAERNDVGILLRSHS